MRDRDVVFSLEISRSLVRVVAGSSCRDGVDVVGMGTCPTDGIDPRGAVTARDDVASAVRFALEEAADHVGFAPTRLGLAYPAALTKSYRAIGQVSVQGRMTTPEDLRRAAEGARESVDATEELINCRLNKISVGEGDADDPEAGRCLQASFDLLTVRRSPRSALVHVAGLAGLEVTSSVPAPLAAAESTLTLREKERGIALAYIDGSEADVVVYRNGTLLQLSRVSRDGLIHEYARQGGVDFLPAGIVFTGEGALSPGIVELDGLGAIRHRWGGPGGNVRADLAAAVGLVLMEFDVIEHGQREVSLGVAG